MPLQLLARPLNLFMGRGNVTHPGITDDKSVYREKEGSPQPTRKEGQVEARRMVCWAADMDDAESMGTGAL